jgi:hypothetical protein
MPKGTPLVLLWLFVASILFSARIGADQAAEAARAFAEVGWTTAEKLAGTSWQERVRVLNQLGYAATRSAALPCWAAPVRWWSTATAATCHRDCSGVHR